MPTPICSLIKGYIAAVWVQLFYLSWAKWRLNFGFWFYRGWLSLGLFIEIFGVWYINIFRAKDIIRSAIRDNDFLINLEASQVRELVEVMYEKQFKKGDYIIREGEPGSHLYVIEGRQFTK